MRAVTAARGAAPLFRVSREPSLEPPDALRARSRPCGHNLDSILRNAASRAMSVREWTSSFFRMWET